MTRLLEWLGDSGADPNDDIETRTRKALLVHLAVLILPISLVWGVLYLALGAPSGVVAFAYMVVSVVSIGCRSQGAQFETRFTSPDRTPSSVSSLPAATDQTSYRFIHRLAHG